MSHHSPCFSNRFISDLHKYQCPQRILMVTDGRLDFSEAGSGLSEFVDIARGAGHTVHTAHRRLEEKDPESAGVTIAGDFDFTSANPPVTTDYYDQLWLFGHEGGNEQYDSYLSEDEQKVIAQFMQSGGGVFATGDHAKIGQTMGGSIPRVRKMRDWSSIPMSGTNRLDTIMDPGGDRIQQFHDQSDAIPKRIFPLYFSNGGKEEMESTWSVHPVLRHPSGAVDCLPDHPHESECLAPEPDDSQHAGVVEWPKPHDGGEPIKPVLVAQSTSAGRFLADLHKPPVMPRCFGAISAYDGHPAGVGRIVCDATWHHFINVNLNGKDALPDANGMERIGLYVRRCDGSKVPTPEYLKIQTYYHNTIRWLAPPGPCRPLMLAAVARFDVAALELRLPRRDPDWSQLLEIGRELQYIIDRRFGPGSLTSAVDDLLDASGDVSGLSGILHSRLVLEARNRDPDAESLLPMADMRRVVFASLVNGLADRLPADEREFESGMKSGDALAPGLIGSALSVAKEAIGAYLGRALKKSSVCLQLLSASPLASTPPSANGRLQTQAKAPKKTSPKRARAAAAKGQKSPRNGK